MPGEPESLQALSASGGSSVQLTREREVNQIDAALNSPLPALFLFRFEIHAAGAAIVPPSSHPRSGKDWSACGTTLADYCSSR